MRKNRNRQTEGETSQVHQSETYCPSIEKALFKQRKLEQLLAENQLKKMGLETAEALIKILYEEVRRLQSENIEQKSKIQQMFQEYTQKENLLTRQLNYLKDKVRELDERQFWEIKEMLDNFALADSSRKLSIPRSSYSHLQSKKSQVVDSPIKKAGIFETVSKQYLQFGLQKSAQLYQQAKSFFMCEQIEKVLIDFEDIGNLVREQKQELQCYKQRYFETETTIKELNNNISKTVSTRPNNQSSTNYMSVLKSTDNKKLSFKGKRLFSTDAVKEKPSQRIRVFPCEEDSVKGEGQIKLSSRKIIKQYEQIIQQYKEYSAYLKAYLCSCIGFISKQTEQLQQQNNSIQQKNQYLKSQESDCLSTDRSRHIVDFPSTKIFPVVLRDILSVVEEKFQLGQTVRKELQKQNKQLRSILDQLVYNLKQTELKDTLFNKPKQTYHKQPQVKYQDLRQNSTNKKQKNKLKDQKNYKNKEINNNYNKPFVHRVTLTESSSYQVKE